MPDSGVPASTFPPAARAAFRTLSPFFSPTHFHEEPFFLIDTQWRSFQYSWGLTEGQDVYYRRYFADPGSPKSRAYRRDLTTLIEVSKQAGVPLAIVLFPDGGDLDVTYPYGFLHE